MTDTSKTPLQAQALDALTWFVHGKRDNGSEFWSTKDGKPEWVVDMCRKAHGDMMPDDHRYEFIVEALRELSDSNDPDDLRLEADIYTTNLTRWLASHLDRVGYCDEAVKEFGVEAQGNLVGILTWGQYYEKNEVLGLVRAFLEDRCDE